MNDSDFGVALRRLRGGRSVRDVAALAAVSKSQISYLESGERAPTETVAAALDHALGAGGELTALAALDPQQAAGGRRTGEQADRLHRGIAESLAASGPMTEAGVEDWEYTVARHGKATRWRPETDLLHELLADTADLQRVLKYRHAPPARHRLMTCLAQLAGLIALTLLKAGDPRARAWWRTGRAAASAAEDRATLSWIYAQEAYHLYYDGDIVGALELAGRAGYVAGGLPCVGPALAASLEARAHALLGRPDDVAATLSAGKTALDRLDLGLRVASALGYTRESLHFHAGDAWTHLSDTDRARDELHRALEMYPATDYTDRALIGLDLAACQAADGEPDAAAALAMETLTVLPSGHRSALIIYRARQVAATVPEGTGLQELRQALALPPAE